MKQKYLLLLIPLMFGCAGNDASPPPTPGVDSFVPRKFRCADTTGTGQFFVLEINTGGSKANIVSDQPVEFQRIANPDATTTEEVTYSAEANHGSDVLKVSKALVDGTETVGNARWNDRAYKCSHQ